jgi:hypothetical protein
MEVCVLRKSEALLLMNMLAAEFGYKVEWTMLPSGKQADSLRLENDNGDASEFRGEEKFEQAVQWLRKKA